MGGQSPETDSKANRTGGDSALVLAMDAVKAHIRDNGLQVGDSLPSEGAFAEEIGVSRGIPV